jgi:Calpain family cysteine protease
MPSRIRDSQIRSFSDVHDRNNRPQLTDAKVVDLLAAVGDHPQATADQLRADLSRPGISRREQFDLASRGMDADEKADLAELLDSSGWQMDASVQNFLEALAGRAPLQENFGPLTVIGDQSRGIVGNGRPGEVVEAINLSTAPAGRLHLTDTVELGRVDASGRFSGNLPDMKEGDLIRLRTRAADGSTTDWLTIQARGVEASDTRNAHVNLERMDLAVANGRISVTHNTDRPISEPNAQLRFTNDRTGEQTTVTVGNEGSLPVGFTLPGQAGDAFSVAVTDNRNNTNFATVAGTLRVPGGNNNTGGVSLPDPDPLAKDKRADGTSTHTLTRFTGPLFIDGPKPDDVRQGAIGDCYFPAAMASLAFWKPEAIRDAIKDNGDGTYTVKFHDTDRWGGGNGRPVEIKVDGDLYARAWGGPAYGSSLGGSTEPDKMELWFPLIEKAYAQWKGSYETIGGGGVAGEVMGQVLGKSYDYVSLNAGNKERVYDQIKAAAAQGRPMAAGTYGTDQADRYTNTGVYANHAYSVLGTEEENGVKYVKLRNPWGQSEYGYDGKNDGFFRIELDKFAELYRAVHIIEA